MLEIVPLGCPFSVMLIRFSPIESNCLSFVSDFKIIRYYETEKKDKPKNGDSFSEVLKEGIW